MPPRRIILHADMDAFFASIEQRDQPELRGRPVIVAGLSPRGVVSAASYEARAFGVHSAMPTLQARALCPTGVFIAPDMEKYAAVSALLAELFMEITPEVEPIALDEAFLDISGSTTLLGEPETIGRRLKLRVREMTGLCVSVGIAENKLLAKLACTLGKPDGLRLVAPGEGQALLAPLPVRRLWTIGRVTAEALTAAGFTRIGELSVCSPERLRPWLGRRSEEVIALANGLDDREVVSSREPKSFGEECTFERDTRERDSIASTLSGHAEAVARRLRRENTEGRTVTLKVRLGGNSRAGGKYPLVTRSRTLVDFTSEGTVLYTAALALWDELALRTAVRLVGLSVSNLRAGGKGQLPLFVERRKDPRVSRALDALEARFGRGIVTRGAARVGKLTPSERKKRGE